ncbi:FecR protein [Beggiatoa alba B18LD]|uniref:FecR protein n=1 Tax=Beggiatoa alba B18LD TaxID=395493 RepID=I3CJQ9_9GAMM|nr:FecR domain-containing protein [Beggiatoa alba]EIJ43852.1 FecR protein [Beggiatoa alba B18LD]
MATIKNFFVVLLSLYCLQTSVMASTTVGKVEALRGQVSLITSDTKQLSLNAGSTFNAGDTIRTGNDGIARLMMIDKGKFAIYEKSELKIQGYNYQATQATQDKSVVHLTEGSFRFLTGLMGKRSPNQVTYETEIATLGIRGTECLLRYNAEKRRLDVIVIKGTIVVWYKGYPKDKPNLVLNEKTHTFITEKNGVFEAGYEPYQAPVTETGWYSYGSIAEDIANGLTPAQAIENALEREESPAAIGQQLIDAGIDAVTAAENLVVALLKRGTDSEREAIKRDVINAVIAIIINDLESADDVAAAVARIIPSFMAYELALAMAIIAPKSAVQIVREITLVFPQVALPIALSVILALENGLTLDESFNLIASIKAAVLPLLTPITTDRVEETVSPNQ